MDNFALLMTISFVLVTLVLSYIQKVGLEKDILIGTVRTAIQLLIVGYILHFIFQSQSILFIILMISFMILVATRTASKKGQGIPGIFIRIATAIMTAEVLTMALLIGMNIIEVEARFIIPISGMIIGNGMVVSGLFLNRLNGELEAKKEEILLYLSLGASAKQSFNQIQRNIIKAAMLPTIDSMTTVGLVQLPGMMTGMIIAGADPIEAVRYQILIMYSFTSAAAITSILLAILVHPLIFNKSHQFVR